MSRQAHTGLSTARRQLSAHLWAGRQRPAKRGGRHGLQLLVPCATGHLQPEVGTRRRRVRPTEAWLAALLAEQAPFHARWYAATHGCMSTHMHQLANSTDRHLHSHLVRVAVQEGHLVLHRGWAGGEQAGACTHQRRRVLRRPAHQPHPHPAPLWQRRYEHMCISCPCTLPVRRLSVLTVGLGGAHSASSCEAGVLRLRGRVERVGPGTPLAINTC